MVVPDLLTAEYIAERWPRLFHMAEAGSWPSIREHGLLSTTALLDLFAIPPAARLPLEERKRRDSVTLFDPAHGEVVIRDNKPITEVVLRRTLVGMTEADFYRTLNGRVFFWLTEARLDKLRSAPPYRHRKHDILVIDTAALLERHGDRVELSPMNSGAVHPSANYPRGVGTFEPIGSYPWTQRVAISRSEPIVELTVPYAVPDVAEFTIDVSTR